MLYEVRFDLLSPLHIGWHPAGNILRTRPYVPGKTLWGAVTAALAESGGPRSATRYEDMGHLVEAFLRFGYFLPVAKGSTPAQFPGTAELRDSIFQYLFLDSFASTAIEDACLAAQPNSLHEIEVLRSRTRPLCDCPAQPVELVGGLWVAEGPGLQLKSDDLVWNGRSLVEVLRSIQLGGKRGYGFGRVRLSAFRRTEDVLSARRTGPYEVVLPAKAAAPAHVIWDHGPVPHQGTVEPWVGREWRESRTGAAGQFIPPASLCYAPGLVASSDRQTRFQVGQYGVWTLDPSPL
ncbi:MAG: hypothetical protein NTW28_24585 [Candidatus Solibacter sp.]|nr:hypothetical protein [Candidatus Solibacter sp.]